MKFRIFLTASLIAASAFATNWTGNGSTRLWTNADNWDDGLPDISNDCIVDEANPAIYPIIDSSVNTTCALIRVGHSTDAAVDMTGGVLNCTALKIGTLANGNGTWNMSNGTLSTSPGWFTVANGGTGTFTMDGGNCSTTQFRMGYSTGGNGLAYLNGGTLTANGAYIGGDGSGELIVNGGTLNVNNTLTIAFGPAPGSVSLDQGTITANDLVINPSGSMDITNGQLILDGDKRSKINGYGSLITAFGGTGTLVVNYDGSFTYVTAEDSPGAIEPAPYFTDNMVLQREMSVPVWGTGLEGEQVEVNFNGQTKITTAVNGEWMVWLDSMPAGGPYTMTITSQETITLNNVMVGDVWFCAGQSNMRWTLDENVVGGAEAIAESANYDIRLFNNGTPWLESTPDTTGSFSAVAYFFGKELYQELNVPIGLMKYAEGGSGIRRWHDDGDLYQSWVVPAQPYAIKGAIWYQGETNAAQNGQYYNYKRDLSDLIDEWRLGWGQGDFPFIVVQLPRYTVVPREPGWMVVRDAQLKTLSKPNTGMAITIDIDDADTLHPLTKEPVGQRLALSALDVAYGQQIVSSGPIFDPQSSYIQDSNIVISFDHTANGLYLSSTATGPFEIAGTDRIFYPADAQISGDTVIISNPSVVNPTAVRYAWRQDAAAILFNSAGLPASPFYFSDFIINNLNFATFAQHWQDTGCDYPYWCGMSDINGNSTVDSVDLAILLENWLYPVEILGGIDILPPVTQQITPSDDCYAKEAFPDTNLNTADLRVRQNPDGSTEMRAWAYLKFTIDDALGTITSAKLKIWAKDDMDNVLVHHASNTYLNDPNSWEETVVTWNNRPVILDGTALDEETNITASSWVELDVSSVVTRNGTYSFRLRTDDDRTGRDFNSCENVDHYPWLVYTFE